MTGKHICTLLLSGLLALIVACGDIGQSGPIAKPQQAAATPTPKVKKMKTYKNNDMVSLAEIDPTIVVELGLFTTDNPFESQFYRSNTAYLRYGTAKKLSEVQKSLKEKGLRLKIWSAYRPFAVQEAMFIKVGKNPKWVSDPYRKTGKKTHVRGVAVDCTLIDESGKELEMPTPYLDFKNGADKMKHSFSDLPANVLRNRKLLKSTMIAHGMEPYRGEWWHYQDTDWSRYSINKMKDVPDIHRALLVDELLKDKPERK
jgi:zinc D-Ala-D-Ala dipeptidase